MNDMVELNLIEDELDTIVDMLLDKLLKSNEQDKQLISKMLDEVNLSKQLCGKLYNYYKL